MSDWQCRLCGGPVRAVCRLEVLSKYDVEYATCTVCGSLQTEKPYWLDEAYPTDVNCEDAGYVNRNLQVYTNMTFLLRTFGMSRRDVILDFGGGLGLVPRLLRELGYNAYCYDTYTKSPFPDVAWQGDLAKMVLAIELFEHLGDPAAEIAKIFQMTPDYVYVRTWRYFGQGPDWDYIAPQHGQHVIFYTDQAMRYIANLYGYDVTMPNAVDTVFARRPLSRMQKRIVGVGLNRAIGRRAMNGLYRLQGR